MKIRKEIEKVLQNRINYSRLSLIRNRRDRKKPLRIKFYGLSLIQEINVWFRLEKLNLDIRSFIFDNNSKSHSLKSLEVSKKI
ncbi:hypothetical protein BpHYR1_000302 [Brachionus plicatilis]|uniref:Uncharacterized protein n=1 Tax=Brachionus plicatilis TaxID=10195 RepID=A0A3M7QAH8_BRAPC|nr:hypothetical protein BpHYR1_000302 [Brachionus plicatilis]